MTISISGESGTKEKLKSSLDLQGDRVAEKTGLRNIKMKNNKSKLAKIFRPAINLNLPGLRKAATRQVDGRSENGGFTLLLSLLVISVILSVGLGVSNIMIKELKLSGLGRESQVAFTPPTPA